MSSEVHIPGDLFEAQEGFLQQIAERESFFSRVCVKEEALRKAVTAELVSSFERWMEEEEGSEGRERARKYLPGIVRLATQNPFEDVRISFWDLIQALKEKKEKIPGYYDPSDEEPCDYAPSAFVPPVLLPPLPKDDDTRHFLQEIFLSKGRVCHSLRLMSFYTSYASKFEAIHETLLFGGGPLPLPWRHYLSILGASRHNSQNLIINQQVEFYQSGGDLQWLRGITFAPKKIQKISLFNALLAHQPWRIKKSHIQELTTGEDSWSVPELVQAICILATCHCLSAFCWSSGITLEVDRNPENDGFRFPFSPPPISPSSPTMEAVTTEEEPKHSTSELICRLKAYSDKSDSESTSSPSLSSGTDLKRIFKESESAWKPKGKEMRQKKKIGSQFSLYHGGIDLCHEDFDPISTDYQIFRLQDFSWEGQGYSLLDRYYPGMGALMDEIFTETFTLTDYSLFDSEDVDTTPFRQAIWYYVLRLNGMFHDDYEYSQVNACLNSTLKKYIKKATCYPELITSQDYRHMGIELFDAEKAHVNFLILEARRQAELLYALHALLLYKGN